MDNANLVRIYKEKELLTPSILYKVPEEYVKFKKVLNRTLAEALFSSKVLLVEGPSDQLLFERIFEYKRPDYEENGIYIVPVNGIGFLKYKDILDKLKIYYAIKTDNDLRKNNNEYVLLGFRRCNKFV